MFRLQDLTNVAANLRQPVEDAVDVSAFKSLVIQVRIPAFATGTSKLIFITSATTEETSCAEPSYWASSQIDLTAAGGTIQIVVLENPLGFLRWETINMSGSADFLIDVIAREV